jgi:hypothetical protein
MLNTIAPKGLKIKLVRSAPLGGAPGGKEILPQTGDSTKRYKFIVRPAGVEVRELVEISNLPGVPSEELQKAAKRYDKLAKSYIGTDLNQEANKDGAYSLERRAKDYLRLGTLDFGNPVAIGLLKDFFSGTALQKLSKIYREIQVEQVEPKIAENKAPREVILEILTNSNNRKLLMDTLGLSDITSIITKLQNNPDTADISGIVGTYLGGGETDLTKLVTGLINVASEDLLKQEPEQAKASIQDLPLATQKKEESLFFFKSC